MFEQELHRYEDSQAKAEPGDLFYRYEIKPWVFGPRLYKILAASAIFNLLVVAVFTQGNLLMRRGCDSPFVGRVCEVLDTVYVATAMFGDERDYVDRVYEKTELADADITYIDVSNVDPPLSYPEGYFQIANPEQFAAVEQTAPDTASSFNNSFPGFSSNPTVNNPLINTPQVLPKSNPKPVTGSLPNDSPFSIGGDNPTIAGMRKGRGGRVKPPLDTNSNTNPTEQADQTAKAEPAPTPLSSDAVTSLEVNKKPLTDFAEMVLAKWSANQVDLSKQFTVSLDGVLTNEGKLDPKKSKWDTKKEKGDPQMINIAKEALEALGDSGFLTYLRSLDVEKLNIVLVQDDEKITAVITSAQKSPERAKLVASGLNNYISIGKVAAKDPSDELTLLKGATVVPDGNNFVLNFAIPKPIAQEMINRKLKEVQAKKEQQPQPQSGANALPRPNDNAVRK